MDTRIKTMRYNFNLISSIIDGNNWYDFGCGFGLSSETLYEFGAKNVLSYEPDISRIEKCSSKLNISDKDTIPSFDNVIAYGVLEHVYIEERQRILTSLWERLKDNGYMVIADTPNRFLPYDPHTTHLPLIPWLTEDLAKWLAEHSSNRWDWGEWRSCGWRGLWLGDFSSLRGKQSCSPISHKRHEILSKLGLHPHLFDPWPLWVWRKVGATKTTT